MNSRSFFLSALIAGVVIGLLGNLPLLNFINCFLCIWVWLGGALSVFLYRRYRPGDQGLTSAQAAGLGALSGLIGAFFGILVFILTASLSAPLFEGMMRSLQIEEDMPMQTGGFMGVLIQALIFLIINLVLYPLFGALAALITGSLVWKKHQAAV